MTQRKLLKIWQNLTDGHKMVLYAYLASCRDAPESCNDLSYYHPNKLGKRCDTDKFSNILIHSHPLKTEADFLMYEIALTKLIRWPFEESANSKPMIKTQIYDFLLFSSALSDKDLKLRDKFFDKVQLIKMTIMLKKDNAFILELIKSASLKKEQITEIFQIAVCLSPLEIVKELVSLGADFKSPDKYERIAGIEAAAYQNDSSVFKFLAEKGFSLQARSFYDKNILHCAAQNSNPNILAYLLTVVPKTCLEEMEFHHDRTPLGMALLWKRKKNVRLLIKAGADKTALKENNERPKPEPKRVIDTNKEIIRLRRRNDKFEWTEENTQQIISAINAFDKKVNEMYDAVAKVKAFLESGAVPNDKIKKEYSIEAALSYERDEPIPTADEKTLYRLYDATNWKGLPSIRAYDGEMESREQQLYLGLNWNIELFARPELEHVKIPYYVHALFVDAHTYTLNDMLHMSIDDFYFDINIRVAGEKIV